MHCRLFVALVAGNCLLFAMVSVMYDIHYCGLLSSPDAACLKLHNTQLIAIYWVQLLVSIETLICLPALIIYLGYKIVTYIIISLHY